MSHRLDVEDISQKALLLNNLSLSSWEYCRRYGCTRDYINRLDRLVGKYIVETSIYCRIIDDILRDRDKHKEDWYEDLYVDVQSIGQMDGSSDLSLRQSFNKIIHAEEVTIGMRVFRNEDEGEDKSKSRRVRHWSGLLVLNGRQEEGWTVWLKVEPWTQLVQSFLADAMDNGLGTYLELSTKDIRHSGV